VIAGISTLLADWLSELRQANLGKTASTEVGGSPQEARREGETAAVQQAQRARQAERTQRYEQIMVPLI